MSHLLSPLIGYLFSDSAVQNSKEFANFVSTQSIQEEEVLVSFHLVSLFIKFNVPTDLAIVVACSRLEDDDTLEDRTSLSVHEIISLLELYLNATF